MNVLLRLNISLLHLRRRWLLLRRSGSQSTSNGSYQTTVNFHSSVHRTSTTSLHTRQGLLQLIVTTIRSIQMLISLTNRHKSVTQNTSDLTQLFLNKRCIKHTFVTYTNKLRIIGLRYIHVLRCTSSLNLFGRQYAGTKSSTTGNFHRVCLAPTAITFRLLGCNCRARSTPLSPSPSRYTITGNIP